MLAGDVDRVPANVSVLTTAEGEDVVAQAERFGAAAADTASSFASGLRDAVAEISRVVNAINGAPAVAAEIPYLGSLIPDSVAGTTLIDTQSLQSLFQLADRFETDIVQPLESYLDSNPTASASQLIAQFDFLNAVSGLASGQSGVQLNFNPQRTFESSLAALLDPITTRGDSLLGAIPGDALSLNLPFDLSLEDFSFDVIRDAAENISIAIPNLQLNLARSASVPINFAADVGFLSGGVAGGSLDLDLGLRINTSSLLGGTVSLASLQELSLGSLLDDINFDIVGDGLNVRLPFDFDLAGFDTDGLLPTFVLSDANPLDQIFPKLELQIPDGADYSAESLLGFHTIDSSSILSSLDQLGSVFGAWQEGDLLNFPLPLGQDVTLGQAFGLAEGFSGAVLQFLKDGDGLPAFNSIQEMIELIPGVSDVTQSEAFSYDPQTQLLTLSLDFFRTPGPIVGQVDLSLIAGAYDSPIGSIQTISNGSIDSNRLQVTRDLSFGLQLQIDLSNNAKTENIVDVTKVAVDAGRQLPTPASIGSRSAVADSITDFADGIGENTRLWTPMIDVLERLGLAHLASDPEVLQVQLRDGSVVSANLGTIESNTTIADWLARSRVVRNGVVVMEMQLVPYGFSAEKLDLSDLVGFDEGNRIVLRDYTTAATEDFGSVDVQLTLGDGATYGYNDATVFPEGLRTLDLPQAQFPSVGSVRQKLAQDLETYLESTFAATYAGERWNINVQHAKFIGANGIPNPNASTPELAIDADLLGGAKPVSYYPVDPNESQTIYPPILAKQLGFHDRSSSEMDIDVFLNTEVDLAAYDYSTTGEETVAKDRYFVLLLHEVLHGLGVISSIEPDGTMQFANRPFHYDSFLKPVGSIDSINDLSVNDRQDLFVFGDDVRFDGAFAKAANPLATDEVLIFNPAGFQPATTFVHVDESLYATTGETLLPNIDKAYRQPTSYTPLTLGILQDLGYRLAAPGETTLYQTSSQPLLSALFDEDRGPDGGLRSQQLSFAFSLSELEVPVINFVDAGVPVNDALETIVFEFQDGSTVEKNLEALDRLLLGDIYSLADEIENLQIIRRGSNLIFQDISIPTNDGKFSISWKESGLSRVREIGDLVPFGTASKPAGGEPAVLVADEIFRPLPYDEIAPVDRTATLGRLLAGTPFATQIFGTESSADITLGSGEVISISSGTLTPETTIADLIETLTVLDQDDELLLIASFVDRSDQMYLLDVARQLPDAPPATVPFRLSDTSDGFGIYALLFSDSQRSANSVFDRDGNARIIGPSLSGLPGQTFERYERPGIFVDVTPQTPTWTLVGDLVRRDGGDANVEQNATVTLRNGQTVELFFGQSDSATIADVIKANRFRNADGDPLAELKFNGSGFSFHDYSGGTGTLSVSELCKVHCSRSGLVTLATILTSSNRGLSHAVRCCSEKTRRFPESWATPVRFWIPRRRT